MLLPTWRDVLPHHRRIWTVTIAAVSTRYRLEPKRATCCIRGEGIWLERRLSVVVVLMVEDLVGLAGDEA